MASLLPLELQQILRQSCPGRGLQTSQLATLYNGHFASPPLLIAYGFEGSDKLHCITSVLHATARTYAVVKCADCLSQRHLLSKVFAACIEALQETEHIHEYGKIDTMNSLVVNLRKMFERAAETGNNEKLILILDGIDQQRGGTATLLASLARLPDLMPEVNALSLILVSDASRSLPLHHPGISYLHFPPYTRNEAISIITQDPPPLLPDPDKLSEPIEQVPDTVLLSIYTQFCTTVYDTLIAPTSSTSLSTFRTTCATLWPVFIWPLLSSEPIQGKTNKSWDFQRLLIRNRSLFQTTGESILVDRLLPPEPTSFTTLSASSVPSSSSLSNTTTTTIAAGKPTSSLLPASTTLLLLSCYLASHTSPKIDILLFSRLSSASSSKTLRMRKAYHRRKLAKSASAAVADSVAEKQALKAAKKLFDGKSGVGRAFGLERVVGILRAVHPLGVKRGRDGRDKGVADEVYRGIGELARLGLVSCVDSGEGEGESLWRVNVRREWVEGLAERVGLGVRIAEYDVQGE